VAGKGISKSNNRLLLKDNGAFLRPVLRTGNAVAELGGAVPANFLEVAQHYSKDLLAVCYTLQPNSSLGVNKTNDSGVLLVNHAGAAQSFSAREGFDIPFEGTLGQLSGRVAMTEQEIAFFTASYVPENETRAKQALFTTHALTGITSRYGPDQGDVPDGAPGTAYRSFVALNERGLLAVLRATLQGGPASQNEGIWNCGSVMLLRKGVEFDLDDYPGLVVTRILKFWPVGGDQLVVQAQLGGTGVKGSNNQALLLRQADGDWQMLMRTGDVAPGSSPAVLSKLSVAEVDRVNGHYAVLATLKGTSSATNQGLWIGHTQAGDDDLAENLRLPQLLLRKGGLYTTSQTPLGSIKGLMFKPVEDKTGAGARGQGLVVGADGSVLVTVLGDRKVQELVRVQP
jgi:hypothetical protein